VDSQHWVEQVRQTDAMRFRDQAKAAAVTVETPRPTLLDDLEAWLIITVQ